jgi:tetratricopeptide (TPR) repeat protein
MGDDHAQASMRKRLARVLADLGETASARAHVDELITSGDRRTRASGLKVRAKLHASAGRYAEAVADCREAVAILREIDQGRPEALALAQLGTALLDAGQPRDAVSPLDEARAILQAVGDPFNVARAAIPLARAHLRLGEHDAARVLLDEADRVLAEHGADRQLGRTHETFAELYEQTGDPDRAAAHRDRAAELFARDPAPCSQVD